ncbi:MAG: glycosyltransferase family 4 protein [Gammaproteobacteria bacterium]|nr:glycosyltransferase family 4 protein [Gammaproteobacteria bacterium]
MKILITNNTLDERAGSELYARDVAISLLKRGHTVIAYSPRLGKVAEELRAATVAVVDDLDRISTPPDLIHGQHHLETMTALNKFPGVPAVYFCHGWLPWEEMPPLHPRILRYIAVDDTCRDRLILEHAIPENKVHVILNFVDLTKFLPRSPLPKKPKNALLFGNYTQDNLFYKNIQDACTQLNINLDTAGTGMRNSTAAPHELLKNYDIVFAKAKCALEAMAVGTAVILHNNDRLGPLVTLKKLDALRRLNFGIRTFNELVSAEAVITRLAQYDAEDAAKTSSRLRSLVDCESTVDEILNVYSEILIEHQQEYSFNPNAEGQANAKYIRGLSESKNMTLAPRWLNAQATALQTENNALRAENNAWKNSVLFRLKEKILKIPGSRKIVSSLVRFFSDRNKK